MKQLSFVLPVCLIITFSGFAQTMKIDVQKGKKFIVESTSVASTTSEVMGQTMENNFDSKSIVIYEIKDVRTDGYDLQSTITKIIFNVVTMGQEMNFDSDKKDNSGPMAEALSKMVNNPRNISINDKGKITKQDKMIPDELTVMGNSLFENDYETELFIAALIGKELITGNSFADIVIRTKEKFNSKDSGTYTVKHIENGVASITYTGTQVTTAVIEQMGMEMNTTTNNAITSEILVDIKTGMVISKKINVEVSANVETGGMVIPGTGKTTITVKITPAGD